MLLVRMNFSGEGVRGVSQTDNNVNVLKETHASGFPVEDDAFLDGFLDDNIEMCTSCQK